MLLFPLWAFVACYRVNYSFTFYLYIYKTAQFLASLYTDFAIPALEETTTTDKTTRSLLFSKWGFTLRQQLVCYIFDNEIAGAVLGEPFVVHRITVSVGFLKM
jgi:hypothetical protein